MRSRVQSLAVFAGLMGSVSVVCGQAINGSTVTAHLAVPSLKQNVSPAQESRAVMVSGSLGPDGGIAILPIEPFIEERETCGPIMNMGSIAIATGDVRLQHVDFVVAAPSMIWGAVRSYSQRQVDQKGDVVVSDGPQGANWFNDSAPEIAIAGDSAYVYLGAAKYLEFARVGTSDRFEGVNGTVGVITKGSETVSSATEENEALGAVATIETFTLHLKDGRTATFWGGITGTRANRSYQFWKQVDGEGRTVAVGDATDADSALTVGYDTEGRIKLVIDAAERMIETKYADIDPNINSEDIRVAAVHVRRSDGSTQGTKAIYTYYDGTSSQGLKGDIEFVRVIQPTSSSIAAGGSEEEQAAIDYVPITDYSTRYRYYRYYTTAWDSTTNPSSDTRLVKLVLSPEGVRRFDEDTKGSGGTVETRLRAASDSTLQPYSELYVQEYYGDTRRVKKAFFNGECNCSNGAGVYEFTYERATGYSTEIGNTTYSNAPMTRTVIKMPSYLGNRQYVVQYFDETGQALCKVVLVFPASSTNEDQKSLPALSSATGIWIHDITRDSSGRIDEVRTPEVHTGYDHDGWSWTASGSFGLITKTRRETSSGPTVGFPIAHTWKIGTSGTEYMLDQVRYTTRTRGIDGSDLPRSWVDRRWVWTDSDAVWGGTDNPSPLETQIENDYWSSTTTSPEYLLVKKITITESTVGSTENGSNSPTTMVRALRKDGTTAFSVDQAGVITYTRLDSGTDGTGRPSMMIRDISTSNSNIASGDAASTWGISSSGSPLEYKTEFTYETLSQRLATTKLPSGRVTRSVFGVLNDGRIASLSFPREESTPVVKRHGPAQYSVSNLAGQTELSATIAISSTGTTLSFSDMFLESSSSTHLLGGLDSSLRTGLGISTTSYNEVGIKPLTVRQYHSIPSSGVGSVSTNYDETRYVYDSLGRGSGVKDATGTITHTVYDSIGRAVSQWVGTADFGTSTFGAVFGTSGSSNMVKVAEMVYDEGNTGKNSRLTKRTSFVQSGTTDARETTMIYDTRGRVIARVSPQSPHAVMAYDNLGRVTASASYSSSSGLSASSVPTSATNRLSYSQTFYDQRGQVYRTVLSKVTQSDGSAATSAGGQIVTDNWYDPVGRLIKSRGGSLSKTEYDRLGRAVNRYTLAKDDDNGTYANADDVTGDTVVEQSYSAYDNTNRSGNLMLTAQFSRLHTDLTTTGALYSIPIETVGNVTGPNPLKVTAAVSLGRPQITTMYYDEIDRPKATVMYGAAGIKGDGTGSGSVNRESESSVPVRSDSVFVSTTTYLDNGLVDQVQAPGKPGVTGSGTVGTINKYLYDDAGRKVADIRNYVSGSLGELLRDTDVYTRYVYANGLMTKMWVDLNGDNDVDTANSFDEQDQVTEYVYGVVTTGTLPSSIASNRLLRSVIYPTQPGRNATDATVIYGYNAQGQQTVQQDQNGTVRETVYDTAGRRVHERVTTLGSGVDGAVRRQTLTYTARGMVETATQYDNASTSTGNIIDQVKYVYDDWGNVEKFQQDIDSAVTSSGYFETAYAYSNVVGGVSGSNATPQAVRLTSESLKSGTTTLQTLTYQYTPASGTNFDDALSRVTRLQTGTGTPVTQASYAYLGAGVLVETNMDSSAKLINRLHSGASVADYSNHLDAFNRVTRSQWINTNVTPARDIYRADISYDRLGSITKIDDVQMKGFDLRTETDGLGRLAEAKYGYRNTSTGGVDNPSYKQSWRTVTTTSSGTVITPGLSQTGNWRRHILDLNGDGTTSTGDLNETNTFTLANELHSRNIDSTGGPEVNYWPGGSGDAYSKAGELLDDKVNYTYVYDAWGRLRQAKNRSTSAVVSEYRYNALGYRIAWHYDVTSVSSPFGPDGTVNDTDPWYFFAYNERWQKWGVIRGTSSSGTITLDANPKELFVHHKAGAGGFGDSSYIDSVLLRERDTTPEWRQAADSTRDETLYYVQNWRADVIGLASSQGGVVDHVRYSPNGVPMRLNPADVADDAGNPLSSSSGVNNGVNDGDYNYFFNEFLSNGAGADIASATTGEIFPGGDGLVDSGDYNLFFNEFFVSYARGQLTADGVANRLGYAGYEFDPVLIGSGSGAAASDPTCFYHVRHRVYDSQNGRWTRRDPLGYVDGMGLYEYCRGNCLECGDPFGTQTRSQCQAACRKLYSGPGMGPVRALEGCMSECNKLPQVRYSIKCVRCIKPNGDFKYTCCVNDAIDPSFFLCTEANDYPKSVPGGKKGNQPSTTPNDPYGPSGPIAPGWYFVCVRPMGGWRGECPNITDIPGEDVVYSPCGYRRYGLMFHDQRNYSDGCITCINKNFDDKLLDLIQSEGGDMPLEIVDAGPCP